MELINDIESEDELPAGWEGLIQILFHFYS